MGVGNTQTTIIVNKALFNASAKSCSDSYSGRHFSTGGGKHPPPPAMLDQKKPGRIRVKSTLDSFSWMISARKSSKEFLKFFHYDIHLPHISIAPPKTKLLPKISCNSIDKNFYDKIPAFTGFSTECFRTETIANSSSL